MRFLRFLRTLRRVLRKKWETVVLSLLLASWIHSFFDNVMKKFMISNRTDQEKIIFSWTDAYKTEVNLLNCRDAIFSKPPFSKMFSFCMKMKGRHFETPRV